MNTRQGIVAAFAITFLAAVACGSSSGSNVLASPSAVAVDSANGRMVVLDDEAAALSVVDTSTNTVVSGAPLVDEDHNSTLFASLTNSPLDVAITPSPTTATTSRIFIAGTITDSSTSTEVSNRVVVFDFDGTTLSLSSFSPIVVDDGDTSTDNSGDILASLAVDASGGRLFVVDKTLKELFIYSLADGTQDASSPVALTGTPGRMAVDPDLRRLFIAGTSETTGEEVMTTLNLDNFADKTEIAMDFPVRDVGVATNDTGTVLVALPTNEAKLFVYQLNTTSFDALTALGDGSVGNTSETSQTSDGSSEQTLITGSLAQLQAVHASDGTIFVYATQSDGNLFVVDVAADLSSFSTFALETGDALQNGIGALVNTTTGDGTEVYVASPHSGLVVYTTVGDTSSFSEIK